jgi:uncharacterized coiled-coil protein SlyX
MAFGRLKIMKISQIIYREVNNMCSLKSLQISETHYTILILIITIILTNTAGLSNASDEENTLWKYNDKKAEEPMTLQNMPGSLKEIQNTLDQLKNQLVPLLEKCKSLNSSDPELQQAIKNYGNEFETKQKELVELKKRIADLDTALKLKSKNNIADDQSIEKLKAKLKEINDKYRELLQKKAGLLNDANSNGAPSFAKLAGTPVVFTIYNNKIIPLTPPYYTGQSVWSQGEQWVIITRTLEGQSLQEATDPNGHLDKILSDINPKEKYIHFFVCSDSIATFRIVAKKVQDAGVHYSWVPGSDKPISISANALNSNSESNIFGR